MHKLAIVLMFVAIFGLIPSFAAVQAQQKSIIKYEQDFNDDTIQVFNELFEDCPAGTVLYKLNGEMVVVCLIDSTFGTIINNIDGSQTIDINVHIDNKKSGHHGSGGNGNNDTSGPDEACLYNASLPKCAPDQDGNCPDGFNMNENGNCFPDHSDNGCPEGTHGVDDDETGQCYKDDEVDCPDGMELNDGNCRYVNEEEEEPPVVVTPPTDEEQMEDNIQALEMASDDESTTTTQEEPSSTELLDDDGSGGEEQQQPEEENDN